MQGFRKIMQSNDKNRKTFNDQNASLQLTSILSIKKSANVTIDLDKAIRTDAYRGVPFQTKSLKETNFGGKDGFLTGRSTTGLSAHANDSGQKN